MRRRLKHGAHVAKTVGGCAFTVVCKDGAVTIKAGIGNVANVTIADVKQSNGVIHVIDAVLLPKIGVCHSGCSDPERQFQAPAQRSAGAVFDARPMRSPWPFCLGCHAPSLTQGDISSQNIDLKTQNGAA